MLAAGTLPMIETIIVLYGLASLDAMFSGICVASGRNALIHKRTYYAKSMLFGFVCGQVACLIGMLFLLAIVFTARDQSRLIDELVVVGRRMSAVYVVYAAVVLFTFAVRAIPSVDLRSMTSTVGFGPLTIIRSSVIAVGLGWGLLQAESLSVVIAAVLVGVLMVPLRLWMNLVIQKCGVALLMGKAQRAATRP